MTAPARSWPALDVSGSLSGDTSSASESEAGAVQVSERLHAALAGLDLAAIDERSPDLWRLFFRTVSERDRAAAVLRAALPDLSCDPADVPDDDWAARSQADLRAVRAGGIVVAPPWDRDHTGLVIVIQPSMGFGTGHHATTRRCLAALQAIDVRGRSVIDVGCGSAVLAIAASLLGAAGVVGFDDDPDAIQAAGENLALNPGARVDLLVGDVAAIGLSPADVVLANLTGGLLVSASAHLRRLVAPGGRLITSGLLTHEEADVRAAFAGFVVERREDEDGWVGLTLAPGR